MSEKGLSTCSKLRHGRRWTTLSDHGDTVADGPLVCVKGRSNVGERILRTLVTEEKMD